MRLAATLLAALAATQAPVAAAAQSLVTTTQAGVYDIGQMRRVPDTGSFNGQHGIGSSRILLSATTHVCPRLGIAFGVQFTLSGALGIDGLPVTFGIEHPAMTNTAGHPQNKDVFQGTLVPGAPYFSFWLFETQGELKPGRWHFTVSHGGVRLADQPFDVDVNCQNLVS